MPSSSGFDPILGRLSWEIPAEVRSIEGELRTAKQVDLNHFKRQVAKSVYVLQLVADDCSVDFTPIPNVYTHRRPRLRRASPPPPKLSSKQQEINRIKRRLKNKLDDEGVRLLSELPNSTPKAAIEREKLRIVETTAESIYDTEQTAKKLTKWEDIKSNLCLSLQSVSDDIFDVTNTTVSVLAPLSIAGTLAIPLQPMLWGWVILIISRVGIKNFCRGCDQK